MANPVQQFASKSTAVERQKFTRLGEKFKQILANS